MQKRKIIRISDSKIYESLGNAAHDINGDLSDISRAIKQSIEYRGSLWIYDPDEIFGEEWLPHPFIDRLFVSQIGRVKLSNGRNTWGTYRSKTSKYLVARLRRNRIATDKYIHTLVGDTWIGTGDVYHIDGDVENNALYNLSIK